MHSRDKAIQLCSSYFVKARDGTVWSITHVLYKTDDGWGRVKTWERSEEFTHVNVVQQFPQDHDQPMYLQGLHPITGSRHYWKASSPYCNASKCEGYVDDGKQVFTVLAKTTFFKSFSSTQASQ
jgi:hypothetical protein